MLFVFLATGADGFDPFDEIVGHGLFALDAANGGGRTAIADPFEAAGIAFGRGKEFVPVVDGADVRIPGIAAAFASRVGDHDFGFGVDVGVGFGKGDGVSVGLGHFAAIKAGDAGSGSEEDVGFCKNWFERKYSGTKTSDKIFDTGFGYPGPDQFFKRFSLLIVGAPPIQVRREDWERDFQSRENVE